jgi:hypothetical protein
LSPPQSEVAVCTTLTHSASALHALTWEEQFWLSQASQVVLPPLLEPELLLELEPHCEPQLPVAHEAKLDVTVSCPTQSVHAALVASVQAWSQVTHAGSAPQAVAWLQQCWARQVSQADVPLMAGQVVEAGQLDFELLPPAAPNAPLLIELQLSLLLLDEHPMNATVATAAHVRMTKRMTGFIGKLLALDPNATSRRSTLQASTQSAALLL